LSQLDLQRSGGRHPAGSSASRRHH
jgi:hypothetical protein